MKRKGSQAGWSITLIERLMAEYQMPLRTATWLIPATAIFALLPALRERHGDDSQPGPGDLAACHARLQARTFLQQHYRIVETE